VKKYDGPSIPIKGKVLLGPISQYTLFNKFPTHFIVHILIVLLDSWLLLNTINDTNTFSREMQLFLFTKFLDPDIEVNDIVIDRERTFYKISDLQTQVNSSLSFFFDMETEEREGIIDEDINMSYLATIENYKLLCGMTDYGDLPLTNVTMANPQFTDFNQFPLVCLDHGQEQIYTMPVQVFITLNPP